MKSIAHSLLPKGSFQCVQRQKCVQSHKNLQPLGQDTVYFSGQKRFLPKDLQPGPATFIFPAFTPAEIKRMATHIEHGLGLIIQKRYAEARAHFSNTEVAAKCGIQLKLISERFERLLSDEQLSATLLRRGTTCTMYSPTLKISYLYNPELAQASPEQQKQLDFSLAYSGLEEWCHALQAATGCTLSGDRQKIDPKAYLDVMERDYAQFLIEQQIPIPADMLLTYPCRTDLVEKSPIYTMERFFPKHSPEKFRAEGLTVIQHDVIQALKALPVGQSVSVGVLDADALFCLTKYYGRTFTMDYFAFLTGKTLEQTEERLSENLGLQQSLFPTEPVLSITKGDSSYVVQPLFKEHTPNTPMPVFPNLYLYDPKTRQCIKQWPQEGTTGTPFMVASGQMLLLNLLPDGVAQLSDPVATETPDKQQALLNQYSLAQIDMPS